MPQLDPIEIELKSGETIIGLFTQLRRTSMFLQPPPDQVHIYDVRHGDNSWSIHYGATIENNVVVNHAGTLFLKEPLPMLKKPHDYAIIKEYNFL